MKFKHCGLESYGHDAEPAVTGPAPCSSDNFVNATTYPHKYLDACVSCGKLRWIKDGIWSDHETVADGASCRATAEFAKRADEEEVKDSASRIGRTIGEMDWRSEVSLVEPGTLCRNDLLGWHREICDQARDLMSQKNKDYASDADPLRNFKISSQVAGITPEQCALIYLGENVAKFRSFIENGGKSFVAGEKFTDHLKDTINFTILLYAILVDKGYFRK